jgi:hypothetical protein
MHWMDTGTGTELTGYPVRPDTGYSAGFSAKNSHAFVEINKETRYHES